MTLYWQIKTLFQFDIFEAVCVVLNSIERCYIKNKGKNKKVYLQWNKWGRLNDRNIPLFSAVQLKRTKNYYSKMVINLNQHLPQIVSTTFKTIKTFIKMGFTAGLHFMQLQKRLINSQL